jgi:hypothetical protein
MSYKNPKALLDAATALPAVIEAKLPEGAPKVSTKLLDFDDKVISKLPDFPVELPDLPAVPELPAAPAGLRRFVTEVEVRPVPQSRAESRRTEQPVPLNGGVIEVRGF